MRWPAISTPLRGCGIASVTGIGFVWDTCHARQWEELIDAVERIRRSPAASTSCTATTRGTPVGSGTDRHANFGTGQIDPQLLLAVVSRRCAVICETADEGVAPTSPSYGTTSAEKSVCAERLPEKIQPREHAGET